LELPCTIKQLKQPGPEEAASNVMQPLFIEQAMKQRGFKPTAELTTNLFRSREETNDLIATDKAFR